MLPKDVKTSFLIECIQNYFCKIFMPFMTQPNSVFLDAYISYCFGQKLGNSGVMNYLRSILMIQFLIGIFQYSTVSLLCHQYQVFWYHVGRYHQCLQRDRLVTQLCLLFWSGGMPVLLAYPQVMSFWTSQPDP